MADDTRLSAAIGTGDLIATKDDGTRKFAAGLPAVLTAAGDPDTIVYPVGGALADAMTNPSSGNPTYYNGCFVCMFNGTTWDRIRGDTTNGLDVDVTRIIPGTSATHLGKAVDSAGGATDTGVAILALRDDALATLTPADGDYTNLRVTSLGALWIFGSVQGVDASNATVTGNPLLMGAQANTSAPLSVSDGTMVRLWASPTGVLQIGDAGDSITVDGSVSVSGSVSIVGTVDVTQSGTWNITNISGTVSLPTGAATAVKQPALGTAGSASADVITVQGIASMTALKVDGSAVTQPVSGTVAVSGTVTVGSHAVTNAGTFAVQVDGAALTALQLIDNIVLAEDAAHNSGDPGVQLLAVRTDTPANKAADGDYEPLQVSGGKLWTSATASGDVAHDGGDSGSPIKCGARATTSQSGLTNVADGDRTNLHAGIDGILLSRPHTNLESIVSGNASNTDGASTECIAAGASGVKHYLTTIILTNTSSTNIYVEIKDGSTAKLTIPVPATGGAVVSLPVPLGGTAATAWNFDPSAAATTVYCSMIAFKSKI